MPPTRGARPAGRHRRWWHLVTGTHHAAARAAVTSGIRTSCISRQLMRTFCVGRRHASRCTCTASGLPGSASASAQAAGEPAPLTASGCATSARTCSYLAALTAADTPTGSGRRGYHPAPRTCRPRCGCLPPGRWRYCGRPRRSSSRTCCLTAGASFRLARTATSAYAATMTCLNGQAEEGFYQLLRRSVSTSASATATVAHLRRHQRGWATQHHAAAHKARAASPPLHLASQ